MRSGPVLRCPLTGLAMTRKARDGLNKLPEEVLNDDGTFDASAFGDCNLFDVRSIAAAAGYRDSRYFIAKVLTNPTSPFHAHPVNAENGRTLTYATHANSAWWGGKQFRAAKLAAQIGPEGVAQAKIFPPIRRMATSPKD